MTDRLESNILAMLFSSLLTSYDKYVWASVGGRELDLLSSSLRNARREFSRAKAMEFFFHV